MAKNILTNTSYRKLDVDAYDPDAYDEAADDTDVAGVGPDERQVSQLLQSNRTIEALKASLLNPPLKSKSQVCYFEVCLFLGYERQVYHTSSQSSHFVQSERDRKRDKPIKR